MTERIGIVCEGRAGFEDELVLTHLAGRVAPGAEIVCLPQGNKPALLADCGLVAKRLLQTDGCARVLIVWDLEPTHTRAAACRHDDREKVFASLARAGVRGHPCVFAVCIERELETWLLAEGTAVAAVLHRPPHPAPRIPNARTLGAANPKGRLKRIFKDHGRGREYDAKTDGPAIAKALPPNLGALRRMPSFARFNVKLTQPC